MTTTHEVGGVGRTPQEVEEVGWHKAFDSGIWDVFEFSNRAESSDVLDSASKATFDTALTRLNNAMQGMGGVLLVVGRGGGIIDDTRDFVPQTRDTIYGATECLGFMTIGGIKQLIFAYKNPITERTIRFVSPPEAIDIVNEKISL